MHALAESGLFNVVAREWAPGVLFYRFCSFLSAAFQERAAVCRGNPFLEFCNRFVLCVRVCVCVVFFFPKSFDPWIVSFFPTCSLPLTILHHQFLLLSLSLFCWFGCSGISQYLTKASSSRGEYLLQHS